MNRRFPSFLACLALALPICAVALNPAAAGAAHGSPDDAEALRLAEAKLAALAKEVKSGTPPAAGQPEPRKKAPAKKHVKKARKKLAKRAPISEAMAQEPGARAPHQVLSRRLTQSEVQDILATTRDFAGTDLSGMSLVGMDLTGVKLNRANLQQANLERADLAESDLELADLTGADLRGASLNQARLRGTRLEGARLEGTMWIDKTICRKGSVGSCIE